MIFADMTDHRKIEANKSPKFAGWRSRLFLNDEVPKSLDNFTGSRLGCVVSSIFYFIWSEEVVVSYDKSVKQ